MSEPIATVIRQALITDLPGILALSAQPGMDDGEVLGLDAATAVFHTMARYPFYRMYVAEHDGAVVGTYALLVMENLSHMGALSAVVEQVLVGPGVQGMGIGTAMMHHAMDEARAAKCYKLTLSSNIKRIDAHKFYDGLGFTRHGLAFRIDLHPEGTA